MKRRHLFPLVLACALVAAAVAAVAPTALTATPAANAQAVSIAGSAGEFHALTPYRGFDSRPDRAINDPSPGSKPTSSAEPEFSIKLVGPGAVGALSAVEPSDVLAVVAQFTVVQPTSSGWLAVRPSGSTPTTKSALVNFAAGRNVGNLGIVGVGPDGTVTVKMRTVPAGRAHVVVDVVGFVSTSGYTEIDDTTPIRGARLVSAGPARLMDTKVSGGSFRADESRALRIRGAQSFSPTISNVVPNDPNVTAVLVNIAVDNRGAGTLDTYISATPTRTPAGQTSTTANINVVPNQVKTSLSVVPIGPDGNIWLRNNAGRPRVVVDVLGYFEERTDSTPSGRIVTLEFPFRALDTREAVFGNVPLGSGSIEDWSFEEFANSVTVPLGGASTNLEQSALIGNVTGTRLARLYPNVAASTYLTAYPADRSRPTVSNLNIAEREDVPNMSLLTYGSKGGDDHVLTIFNYYGSLHYVLDVYAVVLK